MKLSDFCAQSHIPATLIRAVVRQAGGWSDFQVMASEVANYGADAGWHGFIYYYETIPFFKRNKAEILQLAKDQADDLGSDMLEMIAGFNCLKTDVATVAEAIYNPRTEDNENVRNALAWYALEEVARGFSDMRE